MRRRTYLVVTILSGLLCSWACTGTDSADELQRATSRNKLFDAYIWLDHGSPISGPNMSGVTLEKLHPSWIDRLRGWRRHDVCAMTNNASSFSVAWVNETTLSVVCAQCKENEISVYSRTWEGVEIRYDFVK
jgi:hypothetical protein